MTYMCICLPGCMLLLIPLHLTSQMMHKDGWCIGASCRTLFKPHTLRVWLCRGHLISNCAEISKKERKVSSESSASSMICKTMMETVAVKHTEVLKTCWSSVCVKGSKRSKLLYWSISANFSELIRLLERCPRALVVGIWHGKNRKLQSLRLTF